MKAWILVAMVWIDGQPVIQELDEWRTRATCEKVMQQASTRARVTYETLIEPPFMCIRQWRRK